MKPGIVEAGRALAAALERENAALTAMDLPGAAALYPAKDAAATALKAAQLELDEGLAAALDAQQRRLARELAERLRELIEKNRRLLERAIHVQGQVLGTIARAVAMSTPRAQPPRYGASGALAQMRRPAPVVLSARA
jgi:flagellar biosynthesis/type III secretory pathway chaperone